MPQTYASFDKKTCKHNDLEKQIKFPGLDHIQNKNKEVLQKLISQKSQHNMILSQGADSLPCCLSMLYYAEHNNKELFSNSVKS